MCYTISYYIILYRIISYHSILYRTIVYYTIPYHTILYYTIQYYIILYYTVLYCSILYYTVLCYTVLYDTVTYAWPPPGDRLARPGGRLAWLGGRPAWQRVWGAEAAQGAEREDCKPPGGRSKGQRPPGSVKQISRPKISNHEICWLDNLQQYTFVIRGCQSNYVAAGVPIKTVPKLWK